MPCLSQACLLGYTPSPQQAFQGDAAHQAQRHTWLTPNGSPGTWYTRRDYRSRWTLRPFHRTVFTAHTWIALSTYKRACSTCRMSGQAHLAIERVFRYSDQGTLPSEAPGMERRPPYGYARALVVS